MAHIVELRTKKPGAKLTWVGFLYASTDFSPSVNFQCRLLKPPNQALSRTQFRHTKMLHTLVGMGNTVLAATSCLI